MMELGLGVLGWPPSEFWEATPHDLLAALDGWSEKNGGKRSRLTPSQVATLKRMLEEAR